MWKKKDGLTLFAVLAKIRTGLISWIVWFAISGSYLSVLLFFYARRKEICRKTWSCIPVASFFVAGIFG